MRISFGIANNRMAFYLFFLPGLCTFSCANYRYFPLSYHGVKTLDSTAVTMYLVDNEHVLTNVWTIKKYNFKKNDISCTIEKVPENLAVDIVQTISKEDIVANKNQVLLFAKPALTKKLEQTGSITFDYHELDRIRAVDNDHEKAIYKAVAVICLVAISGSVLFALGFMTIALFLLLFGV
jgi:hypothetical protein